MIEREGILYIVATPIGNMDDMGLRAIETLKSVDLIAAEDTRHSKLLLSRYEIDTRAVAYHDHSDDAVAMKHIAFLKQGSSLALISDAGTPLISDPGFKLVRLARQHGVQVMPVPGPSALIAALSVSGLPTDRFCYEGFLPAKSGGREQKLLNLVDEERTMVFYESPHRIQATVASLASVFGPERKLFVGRELTKKFETHFFGSLAESIEWLDSDANNQKGEFVLALAGCPSPELSDKKHELAVTIAQKLLEDVSLKRAAALASDITGARKNQLYQALIELRGSK